MFLQRIQKNNSFFLSLFISSVCLLVAMAFLGQSALAGIRQPVETPAPAPVAAVETPVVQPAAAPAEAPLPKSGPDDALNAIIILALALPIGSLALAFKKK